MRDRRLSWVAWVVVGVSVFALAMTMVGCSTIEGIGIDLSSASRGVSKAAADRQEAR